MNRLMMLGLAALVSVAACGGEDPGPPKPVAGELTVSYAGGTSSDGALLVTVTGTVTSVSATGGYQVASASLGPTSTRVVVTGSLTQGDLFRIRVPDVAAVANFGVTVEAAADRTTFALNDPVIYQVSVRR